jgi:hypothetical protein
MGVSARYAALRREAVDLALTDLMGRCEKCFREGPIGWFDRRVLCETCMALARANLIAESLGECKKGGN